MPSSSMPKHCNARAHASAEGIAESSLLVCAPTKPDCATATLTMSGSSSIALQLIGVGTTGATLARETVCASTPHDATPQQRLTPHTTVGRNTHADRTCLLQRQGSRLVVWRRCMSPLPRTGFRHERCCCRNLLLVCIYVTLCYSNPLPCFPGVVHLARGVHPRMHGVPTP